MSLARSVTAATIAPPLPFVRATDSASSASFMASVMPYCRASTTGLRSAATLPATSPLRMSSDARFCTVSGFMAWALYAVL